MYVQGLRVWQALRFRPAVSPPLRSFVWCDDEVASDGDNKEKS
jgi:hypothetical protein